MICGRIYGFFLTRFGYYLPPPLHCTFEIEVLYGKNRFLDESTDFFVLSSATTPPPTPTSDSPVFRGISNILGYYPKSQDFSQFRLGNPAIPFHTLDHFDKNALSKEICFRSGGPSGRGAPARAPSAPWLIRHCMRHHSYTLQTDQASVLQLAISICQR